MAETVVNSAREHRLNRETEAQLQLHKDKSAEKRPESV